MLQFSEKIGPGEEFTGPKLFRPEAYPAYASSKLCEFIILWIEYLHHSGLAARPGSSQYFDLSPFSEGQSENPLIWGFTLLHSVYNHVIKGCVFNT